MRSGREHLIRRHGFLFAYSLARRATLWRDQVSPPPDRFPDQRRDGVLGRPMLRVEALADRVRVELEVDFSSGHVWIVETERLVAEVPAPAPPPGPWSDELVSLLDAAALERLTALYRDPLALGPTSEPDARLRAILDLFTPRDGRTPDRVEPARATAYELGESASLDDKLPYLTLRLEAARIEIALDHSFVHPDRQRRLEVLATWPIGSSRDATGEPREAIADRMGPEIADAAVFFYRHLDEMFA